MYYYIISLIYCFIADLSYYYIVIFILHWKVESDYSIRYYVYYVYFFYTVDISCQISFNNTVRLYCLIV